MRLTRQAALAIALIAGLLAALLAWVLIGQGGGKPKPKVQEMIQIPVPINTIAAGTELQAGMFEVTEQAKELLPTNVVADAQAMAGYIAVLELPEGQPVRVEQVQERSAKLGMAYALNPGLRGMAVSLDVIGAVGDFIKPLDHVDVLTSFRREDKVVVRTLIQDVVVLALGQTIVAETPAATSEGTSETKAAPAAMRKTETPVTLALTPAQAQIILTADQAGDLRLTLRAKNDYSIVPLPTSNSWSMVGAIPTAQAGGGPEGPSASEAAPQPAAAAGPTAGGVPATDRQPAATPHQTGPKLPKKPYVEVIRGNETEIVVPER
jgi:Flp pilus assembly protein CpaB